MPENLICSGYALWQPLSWAFLSGDLQVERVNRGSGGCHWPLVSQCCNEDEPTLHRYPDGFSSAHDNAAVGQAATH